VLPEKTATGERERMMFDELRYRWALRIQTIAPAFTTFSATPAKIGLSYSVAKVAAV